MTTTGSTGGLLAMPPYKPEIFPPEPPPYSPRRSAWKALRTTLYAAATAVGLGLLHLAMDESAVGTILDGIGIPRWAASGTVFLLTFSARYLHDWLEHATP